MRPNIRTFLEFCIARRLLGELTHNLGVCIKCGELLRNYVCYWAFGLSAFFIQLCALLENFQILCIMLWI